jgi:ribosomal protein L15E
MPAPLSEARMKEIARVVATSPTMAGAATTLGYKNERSLRVIASRCGIKLPRRGRDGRPPLTEERKREIAATIATTPTLRDAAKVLGYATGNSLHATVAATRGLTELVILARQRVVRTMPVDWCAEQK